MKRVLLLGVVALAGCAMPLAHYQGYRGDGTFTPHAAPSALCQDGYTVDLGAVDLTSNQQLDRVVDGLPPFESTIGLAIAPHPGSDHSHEDLPRLSALVTVTLRNDKGHITLSRQERLSQWTRQYAVDDPQHAYLYQRGNLIDVPVAPGAARVERFPLGDDDSWGTYFTPRRNARYTIHFAVDEPDPGAADVDVRLQIRAVTGCP